MNLRLNIAQIAFFVAMMSLVLGFQACGDATGEPAASRGTAMLSVRVSLSGNTVAGYSRLQTRTGEEYEPDKFPANSDELMHTLRVMIVGADGVLEHNTLWDFDSSPLEAASGGEYPVKAGEEKTVVLVANEDGKTITFPDGSTMDATEYFGRFSAAVGSLVDVGELAGITLSAADNMTDRYPGGLSGPLPMAGVYRYYVGAEGNRYSASFFMHRAAVKYTFRIANNDAARTHVLKSILIDNVAADEFLFPSATYLDKEQTILKEYSSSRRNGVVVEIPSGAALPPGGVTELGPYYFPEGPVMDAGNPYSVAFRLDDNFSGWRDLEWSVPQEPDNVSVMTDLPRNTHVVVNVSLNYEEFKINYTVCPWETHSVDIPSFN